MEKKIVKKELSERLMENALSYQQVGGKRFIGGWSLEILFLEHYYSIQEKREKEENDLI